MTVQLTECMPKTTTKIRVRFTGAPAIPAYYVSAHVVPYFAEIEYTHRTFQDKDGWITHSWFCTDLAVTGWRVLKPGPNGEVRVSDKITHQAKWHSDYQATEDLTVTARNELPEFLAAMIEGLRPSGEIHTTSF